MPILSGARGSTGEEGTHKYGKKKLEQELPGAHGNQWGQRNGTISTRERVGTRLHLYAFSLLAPSTKRAKDTLGGQWAQQPPSVPFHTKRQQVSLEGWPGKNKRSLSIFRKQGSAQKNAGRSQNIGASLKRLPRPSLGQSECEHNKYSN